jgi:hypothetical protein
MISVSLLHPEDSESIHQIADLYFDEWAIPKERTISRLAAHPSHDIIFQLIHKMNNKVITTGGLYRHVGLLNEYPGFSVHQPWVAQIVTERNKRGNGLGAAMLKEIENQSLRSGFTKLYLFTFTAENLYLRNNWQPLDRVLYKGHDSAIMCKDLITV